MRNGIIIGAGIGGLTTAIALAQKGKCCCRIRHFGAGYSQ